MKRVTLARPPRTASYALPARKSVKPQQAPGLGSGGWSPLKGDQPPPITTRDRTQKKEEEANALDSVMGAVSQLSAADKKTLLAQLALEQHDSKPSRDQDMWSVAVCEGLTAAIGGRDGAGVAPMLVKRAVAAPTAWTPVADFMAASRLDTLQVIERQSVYRMLAGLVIERAKQIGSYNGAPLSAKLVATVASNVAAIFEAAFPGYLKAGLALVVARRLTGPH